MLFDNLAELLLLTSSLGHVLITPYTKVEESFTLHAVRDLLLKGIQKDAVSQYDHVEFAGAVPRSFVPPGFLAGASYPFLRIASELGLLETGLDVQIMVRLVLALTSSLSLVFLSRRVRTAFGGKLALYFLLISATQFHIPFWMSRTVPNMLAFPLVQVAIGSLIVPPTLVPTKTTPKLPLFAFALLTFATVIFRLELAALLVPLALEQLVRGTASFVPLVLTGLGSAAISLALSSVVDCYFWQKPEGSLFWPEGSSFFFNVVEGKASDWGTSPFYTYFLLSLPKLLLLALPFTFISLFVDRRARRIGIPSIVFIAILSGLEHKEWRFIAYVVPALNVCAASGIRAVGALFGSRRLRRSCLFAILSVNIFFTILGTVASRNNYPGAFAVQELESIVSSSGRTGNISVHVSPHVAMTGATNFLLHDSPLSSSRFASWYLPTPEAKAHSSISYSKSESSSLDSPHSFATAPESFDYLLVDATSSSYPETWTESGDWKVAGEVNAFDGFGRFWRGEKIGTKERKSVGILERLK